MDDPFLDPDGSVNVACTCVLESMPAMDCPLHGDVVSKVDGQETTGDLERALKNTQAELVSAPPAGMKVASCRAHGSPFVRTTFLNDAPVLKVYEDGCKEPL